MELPVCAGAAADRCILVEHRSIDTTDGYVDRACESVKHARRERGLVSNAVICEGRQKRRYEVAGPLLDEDLCPLVGAT